MERPAMQLAATTAGVGDLSQSVEENYDKAQMAQQITTTNK